MAEPGAESQAPDPFGRFSGDGPFSARELSGGGLGDARVKVTDGDEPTSAPEPGSLWLASARLLGFCGIRLRRRMTALRSDGVLPASLGVTKP
jgi:hypothetical protein